MPADASRSRRNDAKTQTPCARYNLEDLVEHLVGSIVALGKAAGTTAREQAPPSATAEARVADAGQVTLEQWRKRGLEGTVHLGESELAATRAVDILLLELLVHAWDFARATARPSQVDDALSGYVLERARGLIAPKMRDGDRFAAEADPGPEADNLARLAAFTGRKA